MQIVPLGQPLRQPNICTICETWPNPDSGVVMVDTLRDFEVAVITKLSGRKYVCSSCADELARVLGYHSAIEYDALEFEANNSLDRVAELEAAGRTLAQATELHAALAAILPDVDSSAQDAAENEGMAAKDA